MICFACPECGFELEFGDTASGTQVRCPGCRATVAVPELGALPAEEAERIVREVAERHGAKGTLRRLGNYPPEMVANAAATFAHGLREGEVPLALIDTSLMQNGKAGLLVTNRCLYSSSYPDPIPLEEVCEVNYAGFSAADHLALWLVLLVAVAGLVVRGVAYQTDAPGDAACLLSVGISLALVSYVLARDTMRRKRGLLVNGELVHRGTRRRGAFWKELLETLGRAAREAQQRGDVPRPQRDFRTRVRQPGAGRAPRLLTCEQCGSEYVRRADPGAPPRAEGEPDLIDTDEAWAWYERLRADPRLVPCPVCGGCPRDMAARARRARQRWMVRTGLLLVPVAVVLFLVAYVNNMEHDINPDNVSPSAVFLGWFCFWVPALLAPGLLLLRFVLNRRWDPNRGPAGVRKELGRERAVCVGLAEPAGPNDLPEPESEAAVLPAPEESAIRSPAPEPPGSPDGVEKPPAAEDQPAPE